jgi:glycosyltransferase involved in cell wall biosynthesis
MRITIVGNIKKDTINEYAQYINGLMAHFYRQNRIHACLIIDGNASAAKWNNDNNCITEIIDIKKSPFSRYRQKIHLNKLIKDWKADIVVNLSDIDIVAAKTVVVLSDDRITSVKKKYYSQAAHIITPSNKIKAQLIGSHHLDKDKISVLPFSAEPLFKETGFEEINETKAAYADGRNYLLLAESINAPQKIMHVLKAFSAFKKWQQSSMKLLIRLQTDQTKIIEKISSYKYKEDVVLLDLKDENQWAKVLSSAYALIYAPAHISIQPTVAQAMQSATPIIVEENDLMTEIISTAALYAVTDDIENLSHQMIKLYKDESLHQKLKEEGQHLATSNSWDSAAQKLNNIIQLTASK